MLKISTIDTSTERRLVLEGKLVEPWVGELTKDQDQVFETLAGRQLVVDLKNITFIGREGEDALLQLMKDGAKFCCNGVLTRHLLKQLERRCRCRVSTVFSSAKNRRQRGKGRRLDDSETN
jgi:hypothetical protein